MVAMHGRPGPAEYYLGSQQTLHGPRHGAEGRREAAGQWWNPAGLFGLADGDPVDGAAFASLYRGFSPDGSTALMRKARGRRRNGTDLVFPADKSVSALWAIADPETGRRIEEAHDDAVRLTLREIVAGHAMSAAMTGAGARAELRAADVMGATFRHGSSRAHDPHLHTHCVILNLAWLRDGGGWRATREGLLHCWLQAAGAVYQHALAWNLRERIGVLCEPYGRDDSRMRIADMPPMLISEWSKRRRQMETAIRGAGLRVRGASGAQAAMFARATRGGKEGHADLEELRPVWARESQAWAPDPAALVASLPKPGTRPRGLLAKLARLPEELAQRQSPFSHPAVVAEVCKITAGAMDWHGAQSWIADVVARPEIVRVDNPERSAASRAGQLHARFYGLRETAESENAIRESARELSRDARFAVPGAAVEERIRSLAAAGYPLGPGDIAAIRHAASERRVAVIEFAPALDRSLVLRPAADLHREQGYEVIGAAATLRAAAELHNESGIASMQINRLLAMGGKGALDENRAMVFVIADAGILLARQIAALFALAERYTAKFLLVAEAGQRPPLAGASGLDLVTGAAGRLRVGGRWPPDRDAVFDACRPERVRLASGLGETLERMAEGWDRLRAAAPGPVPAVVRTRNEEKVLAHLLRARVLGSVAEGARACIQTHIRPGRLEYGKSLPMEIRTGDWLRIGTTLWEARLFRGSIVTVEDIVSAPPTAAGEPRFLIRAAAGDGRSVEFFHDDVRDRHGGVRLGHGYACTVGDLVGRFDRAVVLADDRWRRGQIERVMACCRRPEFHVDREPLTAAIRAEEAARAAPGNSVLFDRQQERWSLADGRGHPGPGEGPRLLSDDHATPESWLSANDGGDGALRRLGQDIVQAALDLRHGETVAALAAGRAAVLAEWAECHARMKADGDAVLLEPAATETLRRHRELLDAVRTLPKRWEAPLRRVFAERGGLTAGDIREFGELYRRLRNQRRIAAVRRSLRQPLDRAAGADSASVEAWLAEVALQRRFRVFLLDAGERHAGPAREVPSWRHSLADAERLIASGRAMLAACGPVGTDDSGREAVRAAVAALEEERREDLSAPRPQARSRAGPVAARAPGRRAGRGAPAARRPSRGAGDVDVVLTRSVLAPAAGGWHISRVAGGCAVACLPDLMHQDPRPGHGARIMGGRVRTAVLPVAGLGTRFLPATKAIPKEMLPVVDRPLIQYAVEEALAAGIENVVLVTGRNKAAIEDHFDRSPELERVLGARGKRRELEAVTGIVPEAGRISCTRQPDALGLGHAVWCAREHVGDEPFAVLLADDLVLADVPCLKQMIDAAAETGGSVVAVEDVPREHTSRYGILDVAGDDGRLVEIRGLVEKPDPADAPSTLSVIGRYVLMPEIFGHLGAMDRGAGGEIQLTDSMAKMIGNAPFHGLRFSGRRFDCGTTSGFLEANIAFALARGDTRGRAAELVRAYAEGAAGAPGRG